MKLGYPTLTVRHRHWYPQVPGVSRFCLGLYRAYDFTDFDERSREASAYLDATSTDYQDFSDKRRQDDHLPRVERPGPVGLYLN